MTNDRTPDGNAGTPDQPRRPRPLTPGRPEPALNWPAPGPAPSSPDSPTAVDRPVPHPVGNAGVAPMPGPGPAPDPIAGDAPDSPPRHRSPREREQAAMNASSGRMVGGRLSFARGGTGAAGGPTTGGAGSTTTDGTAAGGPAGDGQAEAHDADSRRSLRDSITQLVTKVTAAERTMRAAEESAAAATRAATAAEEYQQERVFSPFKAGFFGGAGLLLAYIAFLSLDSIRSTLIVIAVATILAIGLDPAVRFFERRKIPRGGAVTIVFLTLLAVIGLAIYTIIPPIVTQLTAFIQNIPTLLDNLRSNATISDLDKQFGLIAKIQNSDLLNSLTSNAAAGLFTAAGVLFDLVVVLILTLYFLAGFPRIKAAAFRLAPASQRLRVTDLGDKILKQMGGYLAGATIISLQAGIFAGVYATIVGLPYPWAIALGAALLDFVPVVGPIIVGVSMTLLGFTHSITLGIISGVVYLCQHLFEAYWLYPRVMRRAVHISTGAVIVAILVGGALLGVTGALLAVPVAAAVQLIVREVVMPIQEKR